MEPRIVPEAVCGLLVVVGIDRVLVVVVFL